MGGKLEPSAPPLVFSSPMGYPKAEGDICELSWSPGFKWIIVFSLGWYQLVRLGEVSPVWASPSAIGATACKIVAHSLSHRL